jgi:hypothetical protein
VAGLESSEKVRLELEARTLDQVAPGEQQPEVDHRFQADGSATGINQGRRWRDAAGWFSYELAKGGKPEPLALLLTYYGDERGRKFDILANDRVIATVDLDGHQRDRFLEEAYPIPGDIAAMPGPLVIKFAARQGSRTASVYSLRLVKPSGFH